MTLILSGTDGLSDIDGSAATPAIRGTDTNTGIFFPAADTIAFSEGGVEAMRIDSSGNVGIGTSSPSIASGRGLAINGATDQARIAFKNNTTGDASTDGFQIGIDSAGEAIVEQRENLPLRFSTNATERARIDSSGNLLVGTASNPNVGKIAVAFTTGSQTAWVSKPSSDTSLHTTMQFLNSSGSAVGSITQNASSTAYNTSSDYRLKENIAPMTGALAKVTALKPCTYTWKIDGSNGQGFIAHELQAVCPDAVHGEKDAVNEDGSIKPQGIDTSFLVATLTAAIQEQQAIIQSLTARIEALEGK